MQSGKFHRTKIDIQKPSPTQNSLGESVPNFVTIDRRWFQFKALAGNELFRARQIAADVSHEMRFRWFNGLTPTMRLKLGDRVFEILSVVNVEERNRELIVMCKEHVNG